MRDDAGFTLVEQLVAIVIGLAILFAALQTFDLFTKTSDRSSRAASTEDAARRELDTLTGLLRNASSSSPVIAPASGPASTNDLIWTTVSGSTGQTSTVRYCVDTTNHVLWRETYAGTATAAPGNVCGAAGPWSRAKVLDGVANSAAAPMFNLGAKRQDVDLNLLLGTGAPSTRLSLRSSALIRLPGSATAPATTTATTTPTPPPFVGVQVDTTCDANGTKALRVLNLTGDFTFSGTLPNNQTVVLGVGQSIRVKAPGTVKTNVPSFASVTVTAC